MNQIDWESRLGKFIATGSTREVCFDNNDPNNVIKVESSKSFQNVKEWLLSEELIYTEDYHKIAKCKDISLDGKYLVQEYARDITEDELRLFKTLKYPNFLTDVKISNLGVTNDNKIVFRDYGSSILTYNYRTKKHKVRKD